MPSETMALMRERDPLLAAHPFDIYLACDHVFESDAWLSWEPETLLLHVTQAFPGDGGNFLK